MIPPIRLRRVSGSGALLERAIVSVEPAAVGPDRWLVRVARGAGGAAGVLTDGAVYGPFEGAELVARIDEVRAQLATEGFGEWSHDERIAALTHKDRGKRARAAVGLGWRRDPKAVEPLLAAAESAKDEMPLILEALGRIGDPRAIPLARKHADRKLLSRRRAAVEALRQLGDPEGLANARNAALARLPTNVASALTSIDETDLGKAQVAPVLAALETVPLEKRAAIADTLYELGTPACVALARTVLRALPIEKPHTLRYAKSVWKRAMVRQDGDTFAELVRAFDLARRRTRGTKATVKSGLDGEMREMRIFARKTQRWILRASWRYLRKLAAWRPWAYAHVAAAYLRRCTEADLASWSETFLFHRILHAQSKRHRTTRALKVAWVNAAAAKAPPAPREEAYAALWDRSPEAYLDALEGEARVVLDFALAGIARHPGLASKIAAARLPDLLGSTHEGVAALALGEIEARFDAAAPDLALLVRLCDHDAPAVRARGLELARRSVAAWIADPARAIRVLSRKTGAAREGLADVAEHGIRALGGAAREVLAVALVAHVRSEVAAKKDAAPETFDRLNAIVEVLRRALGREIVGALDEPEALAWLDEPLAALRTLGALRMMAADAPLDRLGLDRVQKLANDPLIALRSLAHLLLRDALPTFASGGPQLLFALVESPHADTREAAFDVLRALAPEQIGLDGVSGLCDSTRADVQAFGRELVERHPTAFDVGELLFRLSESPHAAMRRFALDLAGTHLRHGLVPLMRLDAFVRAVLLDVRPDRAAKRRLLELVVTRGLESEDQAAHVAALLGAVVRTKTRSDFDRIVQGLARLGAAYPGIASELSLRGAGTTGGAA